MVELSSTDGRVFYPRARVLWGDGGSSDVTVTPDAVLPWCLSIQVQRSQWYTSDRAKLEFSLFADPDFSYTFWGQVPRMVVDVQIAVDIATATGRIEYRPYTSVWRGFIDKIEQDVTKGIVTIHGRELLAVLNDEHQIDTHTNQHVKEVLEEMLKGKGFIPHVDDILDVPFGRIYNDEQAEQEPGEGKTPADLYAKLAQAYNIHRRIEGLDVYLEVNPVNDVWLINCPTPDFTQDHVPKHKPSNFTKLKFEHNLQFSEHSHQMWGVWVHGQFKEGATFKHPDEDLPNVKPHIVTVAGQSAEQAKQTVENHYKTFIGREWMLDWETSDPRIIDMKVHDTLNVQGTHSTNDGPYNIDSYEFQLDFKRGFRATIKGAVGKTL